MAATSEEGPENLARWILFQQYDDNTDDGPLLKKQQAYTCQPPQRLFL
jgi:hypothetical protein